MQDSLDLFANGHADQSDAKASEHQEGFCSGNPLKWTPSWAEDRGAALLFSWEMPSCYLSASWVQVALLI